jgi:peroxiredoxin
MFTCTGIERDSHGVLSHSSQKQRFEFLVPPGRYTLNTYASGEGSRTKQLYPEIEVKANQSELDLGVINLPPTKITSLIGKPAIEFGPIKAWKNGTPVKLADLKGKAVIIYFDGDSPNTSRDLPRFVDLHEQFADKGLVIIALYNCPDMEYLNKKWVEIYERFGGVTDVPFRVAIDGGEPTFYEGTDKERLGATYGAYDITSDPTTILIDPDGKVVGSLNLYKAKEILEKMLGVKVKPAMPAWRQRFNKVYFLDESQTLKRIVPPFIPERKEYYKQEHSRQASRIERPPDYFTFHWDGELKRWGAGFGSGKRPLRRVLNSNLSMNQNSYEGPEELLEIDVPGDWIVLKDASEEQKLKALEEILAKEIGRDIRFEKRTVERQAIVTTGNFDYHRLPVVEDDRWIHMFSDDFTPDGGGGGGTADSVSEFLQAIGDRVGIPVIDQTESSEEISIPYRHHRSAYLSRIEDPTEKAEKLNLLLDNISRQTELQFIIEPHPVEIWFVTEDKKN